MRLRSTRRCPSPHLLTPLTTTSRVSCFHSWERRRSSWSSGLHRCCQDGTLAGGGRALACQAAPGEDSRAPRPHSGSSSGSSRSAETQDSPPAHSLWHRDDSGRQTGAPDSGEKVTGEKSPRGRWEERAEGPRGGSAWEAGLPRRPRFSGVARGSRRSVSGLGGRDASGCISGPLLSANLAPPPRAMPAQGVLKPDTIACHSEPAFT